MSAEMHTAAAATDIVSVTGRYPGSASDTGIAGFWQALQEEQDLPSTVPLQRWDVDKYFSPETKSRQLSMNVRMAAFVDDLDHFDASLFRCHSAVKRSPLIAPHCLLPGWTRLQQCLLSTSSMEQLVQISSMYAASEVFNLAPESCHGTMVCGDTGCRQWRARPWTPRTASSWSRALPP